MKKRKEGFEKIKLFRSLSKKMLTTKTVLNRTVFFSLFIAAMLPKMAALYFLCLLFGAVLSLSLSLSLYQSLSLSLSISICLSHSQSLLPSLSLTLFLNKSFYLYPSIYIYIYLPLSLSLSLSLISTLF
jgi:hypothetical protein